MQHADERGSFLEWYRFDVLEEAVGHSLTLRQANQSVSKRGVVRGIHYADTPTGQAKYVTTARGAVLDFIVDLRVDSSTFGQWDSVLLDDQTRGAVYLAEGLGHAFVALTDDATVSYLVSDTFNPEHEHGINPLDPDIALVFPSDIGELILSPRDSGAASLKSARDAGALPDYGEVSAFYQSLMTRKT